MFEIEYYVHRKLAELDEPRVRERARIMHEIEASRLPRRSASMVLGDALVRLGERLERAGEAMATPPAPAVKPKW